MKHGNHNVSRLFLWLALSLSALHNGIIQMKKWLNDRGRPRQHMAKRLIIPPDLAITAAELLQSVGHAESVVHLDLEAGYREQRRQRDPGLESGNR